MPRIRVPYPYVIEHHAHGGPSADEVDQWADEHGCLDAIDRAHPHSRSRYAQWVFDGRPALPPEPVKVAKPEPKPKPVKVAKPKPEPKPERPKKRALVDWAAEAIVASPTKSRAAIAAELSISVHTVAKARARLRAAGKLLPRSPITINDDGTISFTAAEIIRANPTLNLPELGKLLRCRLATARQAVLLVLGVDRARPPGPPMWRRAVDLTWAGRSTRDVMAELGCSLALVDKARSIVRAAGGRPVDTRKRIPQPPERLTRSVGSPPQLIPPGR